MINQDILDSVLRSVAQEVADDETMDHPNRPVTIHDVLTRWLDNSNAISRVYPLIKLRYRSERVMQARPKARPVHD